MCSHWLSLVPVASRSARNEDSTVWLRPDILCGCYCTVLYRRHSFRFRLAAGTEITVSTLTFQRTPITVEWTFVGIIGLNLIPTRFKIRGCSLGQWQSAYQSQRLVLNQVRSIDTTIESFAMTAKRKQTKSSAATVSKKAASADSAASTTAPLVLKQKATLFEEHLPPLPLVFTVLFCSGALWVLGLRDLMATGKSFLGDMDDDYLVRY